MELFIQASATDEMTMNCESAKRFGLEAKDCSNCRVADLCSRFNVLVPSVVAAVCIDKLCCHFDMLQQEMPFHCLHQEVHPGI